MIAATYVAQALGYFALVGGFVWWVATSSRDAR